jgi:hypothetical protein
MDISSVGGGETQPARTANRIIVRGDKAAMVVLQIDIGCTLP